MLYEKSSFTSLNDNNYSLFYKSTLCQPCFSWLGMRWPRSYFMHKRPNVATYFCQKLTCGHTTACVKDTHFSNSIWAAFQMHFVPVKLFESEPLVCYVESIAAYKMAFNPPFTSDSFSCSAIVVCLLVSVYNCLYIAVCLYSCPSLSHVFLISWPSLLYSRNLISVKKST